jgi:predicted RNA-binding Zn-ribbon protein involved in translation (DUF1610 family)
MGDLDANILADAARRYTSLRRWSWRFTLGFMALWGVGALFGSLLGKYAALLSLFPGLTTCWVGVLVTSLSLTRFPCPRCGKRFILAWWCSWLTYRCMHCGLDLGPAAMATIKPLPARPEPLSSKVGVWDREFDGNP